MHGDGEGTGRAAPADEKVFVAQTQEPHAPTIQRHGEGPTGA